MNTFYNLYVRTDDYRNWVYLNTYQDIVTARKEKQLRPQSRIFKVIQSAEGLQISSEEVE